MNVLIADDDDLFAQTLARQLARRGHHCHLASNTPEAIMIAKSHSLDAVITDLIREGESG